MSIEMYLIETHDSHAVGLSLQENKADNNDYFNNSGLMNYAGLSMISREFLHIGVCHGTYIGGKYGIVIELLILHSDWLMFTLKV